MKLVDFLIDWFDERTGLKKPIIDMLLHPAPYNATWAYVFGSAILTCFIIQLVTGVVLATLYVPSAGQAFESVKFITNVAPLGSFVRAMHYFGASGMVVFAVIHMIQVYLFGAYKFPREMNWLSGVVLLFCVIGMGFTGQILRWDQNSVWTVAVGASQALRAPIVGKYLVQVLCSGNEISGATLSHFFSLHVFVIPAAIFAVLGLHLWLVLYNGISEPPTVGDLVDPKTYKKKYHELLEKTGKPFWPDAAWRDVVFSVIVVIGICICAYTLGAPRIDNPPDPSLIDAAPAPDWYLLWYFALLALLPRELEDYVILGFPVLVGLILVAPPFLHNVGERHWSRRPWAIGMVVVSLSCMAALTVLAYQEPWSPRTSAKPITVETIGAASGPVADGGKVFNDRGCLFCHKIDGHGGERGPDLSEVADRLTDEQLRIRIVNGGINMPAYAGNMTAKELSDVISFLETRKAKPMLKAE